jgi:hypothetical protein
MEAPGSPEAIVSTLIRHGVISQKILISMFTAVRISYGVLSVGLSNVHDFVRHDWHLNGQMSEANGMMGTREIPTELSQKACSEGTTLES